jgi:hypothetical protein
MVTPLSWLFTGKHLEGKASADVRLNHEMLQGFDNVDEASLIATLLGGFSKKPSGIWLAKASLEEHANPTVGNFSASR